MASFESRVEIRPMIREKDGRRFYVVLQDGEKVYASARWSQASAERNFRIETLRRSAGR